MLSRTYPQGPHLQALWGYERLTTVRTAKSDDRLQASKRSPLVPTRGFSLLGPQTSFVAKFLSSRHLLSLSVLALVVPAMNL